MQLVNELADYRLKHTLREKASYTKLLLWAAIVYIAFPAGCASPGAPTGGPEDDTAPQITATYPESGTTNFSDNQIVFEFSEFVTRSSMNSALRIEPDLGIEYKLDWGRKSVAVEFQRELPDNVTLVLTLGTDLEDLRGNSLSQPKRVAISTGERIDNGRLVARIRNAEDGSPGYRNKIFLIDTARALTDRANYIGEADTAGKVNIGYLAPGAYRVMWVQDVNRNRIWEPQRENAQPFRRKYVNIEQDQKDSLSTLFIHQQDTSKARLQAVGVFSQRRLRLRFSEEIMLRPQAEFSLLDTNATRIGEMYPLYKAQEQKNVLFGYLEQSLEAETAYQLRAENIEDAAGNVTKRQNIEFTGSAQSDTTLQRLLGIRPEHPVMYDDTVTATYSDMIDQGAITDSLTIVENRERIRWERYDVEQNKLHVLPDSQWAAANDYQLRFWQPQSNDYNLHDLQVWDSTNVGALEISISDSLSGMAEKDTLARGDSIIVNLTDKRYGEFNYNRSFTDSLSIEGLPPLEYRLKAFRDENGDGQWNPGSVDPYRKPEPLYIQNSVPVSENMTSEISISW